MLKKLQAKYGITADAESLKEELQRAMDQFSEAAGWYKALANDVDRQTDEDELERMKDIVIKRLEAELKTLQGSLAGLK